MLDPKTNRVRDEHPLRLTFYGRKKHRRTYSTFLGSDSIDSLRMLHERWPTVNCRTPGPDDLIFVGKPRMGERGQNPFVRDITPNNPSCVHW